MTRHIYLDLILGSRITGNPDAAGYRDCPINIAKLLLIADLLTLKQLHLIQLDAYEVGYVTAELILIQQLTFDLAEFAINLDTAHLPWPDSWL